MKGRQMMMNRMNRAAIIVYATLMTAIEGAWQSLREMVDDERGDVVQAVLLMMIAVVAVAFLWSLMKPWIANLWEQITG